MGPKLNLEYLTADECEKIIEVLQKDLVLQHLEQQRIWRINEEVSDNNELCKILSKQNSFNESNCLFCFLKFRLLFRRRIKCKLCTYNFCGSCCVFDNYHGDYLCRFCVKKRKCERQSMEWFYSKVRTKFRRTGSSKIIRYLCQRNSLPSPQSKLNENIEESSSAVGACTPEPLSSDTSLTRLLDKFANVQNEFVSTASAISDNAQELLSMEMSMNVLEDKLNFMDLDNQQRNKSFSYNNLSNNTSEHRMMDLAADQICDITSSALHLIEKTVSSQYKNDDNDNTDDDEGGTDQEDDVVGTDETTQNYNDDLSDVINWLDDMKMNHMNDDESSISKTNSRRYGDGYKSNNRTYSEVRTDLQHSKHLKVIEKDIYKVYSNANMLEDKVMELKGEIESNNYNDDVIENDVNIYENKVVNVIADVIINDEKVKDIRRNLNRVIEDNNN
ncbi:hypothetical protein HELRODRAFT_169968 [Helobdella robusta]|uniref:RabBD domain-containing protein n=1 Tax=Helobdella robusta TaxID=6412 RepID=T1F2H7_HELRO|nr:hypothetical protein HELRODRAFT_169968 [Helobdella robusta]ESO08229.1 hypothetical protein HELRODRAFT_169968 [Helobdella robusta]